MSKRILIVDDEVRMQRILQLMLEKLGFKVMRAGNGREALALLNQASADLLLTDLRMPEMDGIELLKELRKQGNDIPAIVVTAYGTIASAVEAMQCGASDYIIRPFEMETVELAVNRALDLHQMRRENVFLRQQLDAGWNDMVGDGPAIRSVFTAIEKVAQTQAAVLITGETGTGKELVARAIHRTSGRKGLFVAVNCAAIPAEMLESEMFGHTRGAFTGAHKDRVGKFELAENGTVFLDEITEMPIALQAKLLRVLQENSVERLGSNTNITVNFRVITATNRDPRQSIGEQHLREDLYYRLNVYNIQLPPLRERREDIEKLCRHFLNQYARKSGGNAPDISRKAVQSLMNYAWPGNVRELENTMQRSLILCDSECIDTRDLPLEITGSKAPAVEVPLDDMPCALQEGIEQLEQRLIRRALNQVSSKAAAARLLEISERALWYKLKKYRIS